MHTPTNTISPTSQGDDTTQLGHRKQRNAGFKPLEAHWHSVARGGQDMTFARMPSHVKVQLVETMAEAPACWPAHITISRAESKISSDRCNAKKRVSWVCV
jgi:hypothetical protein